MILKIIPIYIGVSIILFIVGTVAIMADANMFNIPGLAIDPSSTVGQIDMFIAASLAVAGTLYLAVTGLRSRSQI